MSKALFITEKPSVADEFAKVLKVNGNRRDGYMESDRAVITWCVGHLVTMSYPEEYDSKLKKWNLADLPFLPQKYKYEIIKNAAKQFEIVKNLMNREDIEKIYVCTDSGREGEYIYRLVDQMVGVKGKIKKRVWIDSQTEEEIKKGIVGAKELSEYDLLSDSAYLRAKEDYLMGINFSRLLTLAYSKDISTKLNKKYVVIAVGRVMTCVLGMVVKREIEIRNFIKTPYYKINSKFNFNEGLEYFGEWKALENSKYYISKDLFKDVGFKEKESAEKFIEDLKLNNSENFGIIDKITKKKEKKNPPLLYNLAEIQNECSKKFKLSPDETLNSIQGMYEKKMLTYPRTDARVLSEAVLKEITKNLKGLQNINEFCNLDLNDKKIDLFVQKIISEELFRGLEKTKYVDDKAITDHYAIIPTGQGLGSFNKLSNTDKKIFILVVRRFLAIFYPPAIFNKLSIKTEIDGEIFNTNVKVCSKEGYLQVLSDNKKNQDKIKKEIESLKILKKGQKVNIEKLSIKDGETSPPKRYSSGSIILAMENAGKLIEEEELREQIKGSGIGTSATRSEILKKLEKIGYIKLNKKSQILTPSEMGEMIYDVVNKSIPSLLNPALTASWEKGLTMITRGEIKSEEYMEKLEGYIQKNTQKVLIANNFSKENYRISSDVLGKCPLCEGGEILENKKAFYCTNWKNNCKFTIWKNALKDYGYIVDHNLIKELLINDVVKRGNLDISLKKEKINIILGVNNTKK